jgi:hypothetical protein
MLGGFPPLYRACQPNRAAVEQQLLRQRGFARIRVRYDRESFPAGNLSRYII